ncbi:hypothetical protein BH23CHL1_BH23CHL1_14200 [soil metagenome]
MKHSTMQAIHDQYRETQSLVVHVVEGLSPAQWDSRSSAPGAPLAFHVWHIAREADILHVLIHEATQQPCQQIWDRHGMGARWGFPGESLGLLQSGIGMDDVEAALLPWPDHNEMIAYLRQSFDAVNQAVAELRADQPQVVFTQHASAVFGGAGTVERAMMRAIANGNRHLGIIGWISTSLYADRYNQDPVIMMDGNHQYASASSAVADK